MDSNSILDLLALIRTESISLAAQARNSSQSAFSRRIQALEQSLGAELVDRSRRPSGPTFQLKTLKTELETALVGLNRLSDAFVIQASEPLRIAALHSISANVLPRALSAVGDILAAHDIRIRSANLDHCFQMLMTEEVVAILFYETAAQRLDPPKHLVQRAIVGPDRLVPVCSVNYLPILRTLVEQGKALPLICYPSGSFLGDITRSSLLPQIPYSASMKIVSGLTQAVQKCIETGLGCGWLPSSSIHEQLVSGDLVNISNMGFPDAEVEMTMLRLRKKGSEAHKLMTDAICAEISAILSERNNKGLLR